LSPQQVEERQFLWPPTVDNWSSEKFRRSGTAATMKPSERSPPVGAAGEPLAGTQGECPAQRRGNTPPPATAKQRPSVGAFCGAARVACRRRRASRRRRGAGPRRHAGQWRHADPMCRAGRRRHFVPYATSLMKLCKSSLIEFKYWTRRPIQFGCKSAKLLVIDKQEPQDGANDLLEPQRRQPSPMQELANILSRQALPFSWMPLHDNIWKDNKIAFARDWPMSRNTLNT